jgi:prolyl 4-hydroxylase
MAGWFGKTLSFSVGAGIAALLAATSPQLQHIIPVDLSPRLLWHFGAPPANATVPYACLPQAYTTQIVSLDPLVIYIENFLGRADIDSLLAAADGLFKPSTTTKYGRTVRDTERTSWSAALPMEQAAVRCVLDRARAFMGTMFAPGRDEMGLPQLVRYKPKQKFNKHMDWYPNGVPSADDRDRRWNRPVSFFAILADNCTEGETYFPHIHAVAPQHRADKDQMSWREHEDGGLAFKPVAGNALFWVNLHANGTGDRRTEHAGLPVTEGLKIAMNIWPKQYTGPEAWSPEEKISEL